MNRQSVSYLGGLVAIMLVTAATVQAKNLKAIRSPLQTSFVAEVSTAGIGNSMTPPLA